MKGRHIKGYTKYLALLEIILILSFDGKMVLQHGGNNGIDWTTLICKCYFPGHLDSWDLMWAPTKTLEALPVNPMIGIDVRLYSVESDGRHCWMFWTCCSSKNVSMYVRTIPFLMLLNFSKRRPLSHCAFFLGVGCYRRFGCVILRNMVFWLVNIINRNTSFAPLNYRKLMRALNFLKFRVMGHQKIFRPTSTWVIRQQRREP